jgi:MinD-like ATPase involved in chromosome partitioning or flagellar assembly
MKFKIITFRRKELGAIVTLHSYKGGTGKTSIAIGLAEALAASGKKICLMDLDFNAPTISLVYNLQGAPYFTNDYLNAASEVEQSIFKVETLLKKGDNLFVGPANMSTEAIRDISSKDRKWHMRALGRLLSTRETLLRNKKFDYIILDIGHGLSYPSINAIVCSNTVVLVNTPDQTQNVGTMKMLTELYNLFDKKTAMVINKSGRPERNLANEEASKIVEFENRFKVPVLGIIPCFCDVNKTGLAQSLSKPNHLFLKIITEIAFRYESFNSGRFLQRENVLDCNEEFMKKIYGFIR